MKKNHILIPYLKTTFFVLLLFNFSSCDKCSDIACFTPPEPFHFQLIDKVTNQNLLQNGTYTLADIRIKSIAGNNFHTLQLDSAETEGQKHFFLIDHEIGWENGEESKNYILSIKDSLEYNFVYHSEKKSENCCSFYQKKEIDFAPLNSTELNSPIGFIYKIEL